MSESLLQLAYQKIEGDYHRELEEAKERAENLAASQELERRQRVAERKRKALKAQIAALEAELAEEEEDLKLLQNQAVLRREAETADRDELAMRRRADRDKSRE